VSGGSNANKRDVRTVFDADSNIGAGIGHRPRMLSDELRLSERRVSRHRTQGEESPSLGERVEQEFEKVKADAEHAGGGFEGWVEGVEGTGIGQLYRGFGMGVGALVLVLVLGLITGEEAEGWAEL
jgi:mitochondrial fusion and transport protein UGO1